MESVHDILDKTLRLDEGISPGLREFGWNYLNSEACREYRSHLIKDLDIYLGESNPDQLKKHYNNYLKMNETYFLSFGRPEFYDNMIVFRDFMGFTRLDEKYHSVFTQDTNGNIWNYSDGVNVVVIDNSRSNDTVLFNRKADQFYYFNSKNVAENEGNLKVFIEQRNDQKHYFFKGIKDVSITPEGDMIAGLSRMHPKNEKLSFIVYDVPNNRFIKTGVELQDEDHIFQIDWRTVLSRSGKYAAVIIDKRLGYIVFDILNQKLIRSNYGVNTNDAPIYRIALEEEKGLIAIANVKNQIQVWNFHKNLLLT